MINIDSSQSTDRIIALYKALLEQQNSYYTNTLYALLGIAGLMLTIAGGLIIYQWWWNKEGATKYINEAIKEELEKKQPEIQRILKEKLALAVEEHTLRYDRRFLWMEKNINRSLALHSTSSKLESHAIYYWAAALDNGIALEEERFIRTCVNAILAKVKSLDSKAVHNLEAVKKSVEKIPGTLTQEKEEILRLLKDCKEYEKNLTKNES